MTGDAAIWFDAARPRTLVAAIAPVAVGTACAAAEGGSRPAVAIAALAASVLIQIGTNLTNDVADFERGADGADRLGPVRATAAGLLPARSVKLGALVAFAAALVPGLFLVSVAGWPVLVIGALCIIAGAAYTTGPYPLAYHGLGDPFVFAFFGVVGVTGTAFVQLGRVPSLAFAASIPVGALATAILVVNNLRDIASDARAGKRTLAVAWGATVVGAEYLLLLAAAYAVPIGLWTAGRCGDAVLLPLATLPLAIGPVRAIASGSAGRDAGRWLPRTALLLLTFSLALAIGIAA